jgi:hypothetical protein
MVSEDTRQGSLESADLNVKLADVAVKDVSGLEVCFSPRINLEPISCWEVHPRTGQLKGNTYNCADACNLLWVFAGIGR